jgi:general secretion pathway protein D
MKKPRFRLWLLAFVLSACSPPAMPPRPGLTPLPALPPGTEAAAPRVDGFIGTPQAGSPAQLSYGRAEAVHPPAGVAVTSPAGDISLEFADADIREVVAQILGGILHVNYTIDPAVHGTVTLRTAAPLARPQLIPALQTLLSQNGSTMVQSGGLYRVLPAAAVPSATVSDTTTAGVAVVPLRYAQADDLVKALQPFVGAGGRIVAAPSGDALLIGGEPDARNSLVELVRAFDIDVLAGQSYALLPIASGGARDFASQLQDALRTEGGGALANQVRVVPMDRVEAVLVVSSRPAYIEAARRIYQLVEATRRHTVRSWHIYYLQNSRSNEITYELQRAFTPNNVTARPSADHPPGGTAPGGATQIQSTSPGAGTGQGASTTGGAGIQSAMPTLPGIGGTAAPGASTAGGAVPQPQPAPSDDVSAGPLLGGLGQGGGTDTNTDTMRIVPNPQNNAVLVYGTPEEEDTVVAMLRKIDILPLQVRIDATVAEVTLNDALQYGTQYYFKQGGLNGVLTAAFNTNITGFSLGSLSGFGMGGSNGNAQFAISALQAVTDLRVLSSPQLLVLDNQTAQLQVGDLVPYLTTSSQGTLVAGSPVINSIAYQQTGVILNVTPRVNGGGLVTLDISQVVSEIDPTVTTTTTGIDSPAFSNRSVQSRVVVHDGQTIGLAGLIQDSVSKGNTGFPILKDIPVLGALFGQQNNNRTRTELLILVTPHVLYDQRDARSLTEDLREHLSGAAAVPTDLQRLKASGSADPSDPVVERVKLPE